MPGGDLVNGVTCDVLRKERMQMPLVGLKPRGMRNRSLSWISFCIVGDTALHQEVPSPLARYPSDPHEMKSVNVY